MIDDKKCIGCQACKDICPNKAISFKYDLWGQGCAKIDRALCCNCGLCDSVCPSICANYNQQQQTVYAVVSKTNSKTGSSGGVFYELASKFILDGGVVFGAGFSDDLKLKHLKAQTLQELPRLCKSKYIHSDMQGAYQDIEEHLKRGQKVMFVGTPCQASAVKNLFIKKYRNLILIVDFLCHGTGTQKVFDACISQEEKKQNAKITQFNFRAKTKRAEHSFSYALDNGKLVKGYAFEFPYYYSYLKYNIFNEYCYTCNYAKETRVGDITLGDFWGIKKHNKKLDDKKGVSLILCNNQTGKYYLEQAFANCNVYEYQISCAKNNQSLTKCVPFPASRLDLVKTLQEGGQEELVKKLACPNIAKHKRYEKTPAFIKKLYNRIRG